MSFRGVQDNAARNPAGRLRDPKRVPPAAASAEIGPVDDRRGQAGRALTSLACAEMAGSDRVACRHFFGASPTARAAALMIATDVIVAPLVASIPLTACFSR